MASRRKTPKSRKARAEKFLEQNPIERKNGNLKWAMPDEIGEIVDLANERRLAGESSNARTLAKALKAHFDIPINVDTLTKHIKERVGRRVW